MVIPLLDAIGHSVKSTEGSIFQHKSFAQMKLMTEFVWRLARPFLLLLSIEYTVNPRKDAFFEQILIATSLINGIGYAASSMESTSLATKCNCCNGHFMIECFERKVNSRFF